VEALSTRRVLWTGFVLNGLLAIGLLVVLIGLLTGDTGIGWDYAAHMAQADRPALAAADP
jgi:hypothetical protein